VPRKQPRWSAPLARPVVVKDGPTLRTLHDVRAFMLSLPEATQLQQSWQKAAELLLAASDHAGVSEALTRQIELALFIEGKLVLSK
jgi:hypothetical protein